MEKADKPTTDALCKKSYVGTVSNVPAGMVPESDTANLAILSYDPKVFSKGRSPLEALSMGIDMAPDETAYRCNVVTVSDDEGVAYEDRVILDHSADEISTAEADVLIKAMQEHFGNDRLTFHTGISYRHCLIMKNGNDKYNFARPHDHLGERIGDYLPRIDDGGEEFYRIMKESFDLLNHHPINEERRKRGLKPANSAWFWSPGKKPALPSFKEKWGLDGVVISAVDLIKGIGLCAKMKSIDVEGATGNVHTNYDGKAEAAINAFKEGAELVYVHVEGPDECGHRAETDNKVKAIELIDKKILAPIYEYLKICGEDFKIMILPDHPTPIRLRTHTITPVPFMIYSSNATHEGAERFTEALAETSGNYLPRGHELIELMLSSKV
jgi:2,3-bisphosphoglycerate-independent phosphoglycerate mutase